MNYDNDISAEEIFQLTDALAQESDILQIIDKTMQLAQQACNADGVSYYTISDDNFLRLVYSHSRSLKICPTRKKSIPKRLSSPAHLIRS